MHFSLFTEFDIELFKAGKHFRLYEKLGARPVTHEEQEGVYFAVWAPNAEKAAVVGNFNGWDQESHPMNSRWDGSGIWEVFIPGIGEGEVYKYYLKGPNGYEVQKADPYGYQTEEPPKTASVVRGLDYQWNDGEWLKEREKKSILEQPLSIYEMHPGSWRRKDGNEFLSYRELAEELPKYCLELGFTHVELMPVMEHPFYGSWGYQLTGYFAPSSRFGTPQDFMFLVDALHQSGIGVILDWVPSHFPSDEHGLGYFDGTHLYEHPDPRKGFHKDWNSLIFNYGRNEVRAFLISNALYWLDKYHIDGLRVDAVASMLYLDYSRNHGEWEPNEFGGRENLDAVSFIQEFNLAVQEQQPHTFTVAEESTAYPGVTAPVQENGLGFDLKWMMGWMHDTLAYFQKDPMYRSHHQGQLAFSIHYAFSEKFVLPLSHDEVVYGKNSLINKMPGDDWQQFANLRLLFSYMWGHPGGKLVFMGGEFGQQHEWRHDFSLDWHEQEHGQLQQGVSLMLKDLNQLYQKEPALYENNYSPEGFEWVDFNDAVNSVFCWLRKGKDPEEQLIFIGNFTPNVLRNYRVGVARGGRYAEVFNSDDWKYGGSGVRNQSLETTPVGRHGQPHSLSLTLPPLGVVVLKRSGGVWGWWE